MIKTTGQYSDEGASECSECPAGFYCDETALSKEKMETDKKCPAGKYCEAGFLKKFTFKFIQPYFNKILSGAGQIPTSALIRIFTFPNSKY